MEKLVRSKGLFFRDIKILSIQIDRARKTEQNYVYNLISAFCPLRHLKLQPSICVCLCVIVCVCVHVCLYVYNRTKNTQVNK